MKNEKLEKQSRKNLTPSDYAGISNFNVLLNEFSTNNVNAVNYVNEIVYLEQNESTFNEIRDKVIQKGINSLTSDERRLWTVITIVVYATQSHIEYNKLDLGNSFDEFKKTVETKKLPSEAQDLAYWGINRFDSDIDTYEEKLSEKVQSKGMQSLTDDEVKDLKFIKMLNDYSEGYVCTKKDTEVSKPEHTALNMNVSELKESYLNKFFKGFLPVRKDKSVDMEVWGKAINRTDYSMSWKNTSDLVDFKTACTFSGFAGVLRDDVVVVDVDAHESVHTTNEERAKMRATVEFAKRFVIKNNLNCLMIQTTTGVHLYFKDTSKKEIGNVTARYNALNMKCDYKGYGKGYTIVKLDGTYRKVLHKSNSVDEIPKCLRPYASKPFLPDIADAMFPYSVDLQGARHDIYLSYSMMLYATLKFTRKEIHDTMLAVDNCLVEPYGKRNLENEFTGEKAIENLKQKIGESERQKLDEKLEELDIHKFVVHVNSGETIEEISNAIAYRNSLLLHKDFIGFKYGIGLTRISSKNGKSEEYQPAPKELKGLLETKDFFWTNNRINKEDGSYMKSVPTIMNYEQICSYQNELDLPAIPAYSSYLESALLDTNGNTIHGLGYTAQLGGLYFGKDVNIAEVPEVPTEEDVACARRYLWELFHDFNFALRENETDKEDSCSYHNTLVMLGLGIFRPYFDCSYPICVITKGETASGATTLSETICRTVSNQNDLSEIAMQTSDAKECAIKFDDLLRRGKPLNIIDNCNYDQIKLHEITNLMCITTGSGTSSTRVYGSGERFTFGKKYQFFVNGISTVLSDDLARRCIVVNLKRNSSIVSETHDRTKQELQEVSLAYHGKIIWAFAVFIKNWIAQGKISSKKYSRGWLQEYASSAGWIANVLSCAGYTRMFDNMEDTLINDNPKNEKDIAILSKLHDIYGDNEFVASSVASHLSDEWNKIDLARKQNTLIDTDDFLLPKMYTYIKNPQISRNTVAIELNKLANVYVDGSQYELKFGGKNHRYSIINH